MLIKPDLKDEDIVSCLRDTHGLDVRETKFLPIGADLNTTVYQVTTKDNTNYFLKLRRKEFKEAAVSVPKYLADHGLKQLIPPVATKIGQLWTNLSSYKAILYPYVDGHNAIDAPLSDKQWREFGAFMKQLHSFVFSSAITKDVEQETFSSQWRDAVKTFLQRVDNEVFQDPVAVELTLFLKSKNIEICNIVSRAEKLAVTLQKQPLDYVLCHADIHGWNLLIGKDGLLHVVDWDTLIFAPKERDLMFIGAGIWHSGHTPDEETALFYKGYGYTDVNENTIAYYRFERIIQDIGEYCEHIFASGDSEDDRRQSLKYLQSNFVPNGTIDRAYQSDRIRRIL